MARRLRLQNKKDKPRFQRPVRVAADEPNSDGFSMKFSGGCGILALAGESLNDGIDVPSLEILIDNIAFPFDVSKGARGLANRRLKLHRLSIDMGLDALMARASARVAQNGWVHEVEAAFYADHVCMSLLYGPEDTAVPLSFRLVPLLWQDTLAFAIDDIRCYGAMPGVLLNVASLCMSDISGFRMDGAIAIPDDPVKQILLKILPSKGWRLPSYDNMQIAEFSLQPRRCRMTLARRTGLDAAADVLRALQSMPTVKRLEELRHMRDVDSVICQGDPDEARRMLTGILGQHPDNPAAVIRLAMLNIMDPARRDAALQQLGSRQNVWNRADLLTVLAHGAALAGDAAAEKQALSQLFELGTPVEKLLAAMRIAELVSGDDAATAISYLEQAVSVRRDNPDALLALMEMYALQRNVPRLKAVLGRWIAIHSKHGNQTAAHLEAGRVLSNVLEWGDAAVHFEAALSSEPDNIEAAWGLAEALAGKGELQRAIAAYEQLARRSHQKSKREKEAEALTAIGELWLKHGEPEMAVSRLQDAIGIRPESHARLKLAEAMASLGRFDQAVMHYEEALETALSQDVEWANGALTLARLFFEQLDDLDAARHWVEQASRVEAVLPAAHQLKIQVLEKQRRWNELAVALERNLLRDGENASLDTVAHLARARVAVGELTSAISTIESALLKNPTHGPLLDVYIDALRRQKDHTRLLDALERRVRTLPPDAQAPVLCEIGDVELTVRHNPGEAAQWYREAMTLEPDSVRALAGLVEAMHKTDDPGLPGAVNRLVALYEASGERVKLADMRILQVELLLRQGDGEAAVALLQDVLPTLAEGRKGDALMQIAGSLLSQGEYALAREILSILKERGDATDVHEVLLAEAVAAFHLGDYDGAYDAAIGAGSGPVPLRAQAVRVLTDAAQHIGREREALDMLNRVAENLEVEEAVSLWELGATLAFDRLEDVLLAKIFHENILRVMPEHAGAKNRLLTLLESSGLRAELARALVRFYGGKPDETAEVKRAADFFLADELFDEAVVALQEAYALKPDVESARMLATALTRAGRQDEALRVLSEIAIDDDSSRDMLLEQYEARGDWDAMVSLLSGMTTQDSVQEGKRLEKLARLMLQKGDPMKAAGYFLDAAKVGTSQAMLRHLYDEVMKIAMAERHPQLFARAVQGMSVFATEAESAALKLSLAVQYYQVKMIEEAELLLEPEDSLSALPFEDLMAAVQEHRGMKPLIFRVLGYALTQERWSEADQLLTLLLFLETEESRFQLLTKRAQIRTDYLQDRDGAAADWMEIGEYHQQSHNDAVAMVCYRRALALNGANVQALMILGDRAYAAQDWPELQALLNMVTEVSWHPRIALWKATVAEQVGDQTAAFVQFEELMDRAPQMDEANEGYLRTVPESGYEATVRQALDVVRRKGVLGQMSAAVHRKAARAYLHNDEMDKARRHLEIALSLDPLDKSSLLLLAKVYESSGQYSARAYTLEKIADLVTGDEQIDYYVASGRVFLDDLHDPVRGGSLFARAAAISRDEPDVLLGLADCAWAREDWAGAAANMKRLRVVAPHLAIDPLRIYRFAVALSHTGEWPLADVIELLERIIPHLEGAARRDADAMLEDLKKTGMTPGKER